MEKGKDIRKKKKKRKTLFEWSKKEELDLLKKLVEFSTKDLAHEEFYPFLRNGSPWAKVPKIQIFDKIQQLKSKYLNSDNNIDDDHEKDEEACFELSKRLWGNAAESSESKSVTTLSSSRALDASNQRYFEERFESHGLELHLFTTSLLEKTKKEVDELFCLQNHQLLHKSKLKAQLAQLKHNIAQARFKNHANSS